jgi:hypothetical protein
MHTLLAYQVHVTREDLVSDHKTDFPIRTPSHLASLRYNEELCYQLQRLVGDGTT